MWTIWRGPRDNLGGGGTILGVPPNNLDPPLYIPTPAPLVTIWGAPRDYLARVTKCIPDGLG